MGDADLETLRAKRLAELQQQYGQHQGQAGNAGDQQQAAKERENQMVEAKNMILSQALDQAARARLNTLMIAKPDKGKAVENLIVNMVQTGRIRGKVTETEFVGMLEQINSTQTKTSNVKFDRRRAALDDSDDDFN